MTIRLLPEIAILHMLAFARIGAILMLLPGIGETAVSPRIRLAVAVLLTLVLQPIAAPLYPGGLANKPAALGAMLGGEIAIGLFIGMASRLVLAAAQVAGTTIANQLGLGFAMTVDPTQGQQGVIFGNFLSLMAVTMIFVTDLHVPALSAVSSSFTLFPPGDWVPVGDFAEMTVKLVGESFRVGLQVSAPFLAFGLIFNLGLGMLQKMMPQFQIFFVAMPLSIGVGLVLFALVLATTMLWYMDHVRDAFGRLVAG